MQDHVFQPMMPVCVVDLNHRDDAHDFAAMKVAGIRGVIHKASEGKDFADPKFAERRKAIEAVGLLMGAYHWCNAASVEAQVTFFLHCCGSLDGLLLAADFENHPHDASRDMSLTQLREFLTMLMQRTGRGPCGIWLYGGNRFKEEIVAPEDRSFFGQFNLWLCQYGPRAILPAPWKRYGLWQCSADGHGNPPHTIPGSSTYGIDLNVYGGANADDLASEWAQVNPQSTPIAATADVTR